MIAINLPAKGLAMATLCLALAFVSQTPAAAQSYHQYCHERAQRLSNSSAAGDVVGGAARGALGGAVVGSIFGSNSKDRRRGAAAGALIGGIASANRPNSRAARAYQLEYDDCMRRR